MARKSWRGVIGSSLDQGQRAAEERGPIHVGAQGEEGEEGCPADSWWCQSWGQRAHGKGTGGGAALHV